MSFKEITLYLVVCDDCGREDDYNDGDNGDDIGAESREEALQHALNSYRRWVVVDGRHLGPCCRPCERCGNKSTYFYGGNMLSRPGGSMWLCDRCSGRPCGTCGHQYRRHDWRQRPGGSVVYRCTESVDFCDCPVFAEATGEATP